MGDGIPKLLERVNEQLYESLTALQVQLPYREGALISTFHEFGQVDALEHVRGGVKIRGRLPGRLIARFKPFVHDVREYPGIIDEVTSQELAMDDDELFQ